MGCPLPDEACDEARRCLLDEIPRDAEGLCGVENSAGVVGEPVWQSDVAPHSTRPWKVARRVAEAAGRGDFETIEPRRVGLVVSAYQIPAIAGILRFD